MKILTVLPDHRGGRSSSLTRVLLVRRHPEILASDDLFPLENGQYLIVLCYHRLRRSIDMVEEKVNADPKEQHTCCLP